jgi:hypothetical protein
VAARGRNGEGARGRNGDGAKRREGDGAWFGEAPAERNRSLRQKPGNSKLDAFRKPIFFFKAKATARQEPRQTKPHRRLAPSPHRRSAPSPTRRLAPSPTRPLALSPFRRLAASPSRSSPERHPANPPVSQQPCLQFLRIKFDRWRVPV